MAFSLPLGYRFNPTDEEIIVDLLYKKIKGSLEFSGEVMDCDVYGEEEEWMRMLQDKEMYTAAGEDIAMYFFTMPKKKSNEKGNRMNRVTNTGTWKTQKDQPIHIPGTNIHIGSKRSFKFVPKKSSRTATARGWIMHEFRLDGQLLENMNKDYDHCVLCKIKTERKKKKGGRLW